MVVMFVLFEYINTSPSCSSVSPVHSRRRVADQCRALGYDGTVRHHPAWPPSRLLDHISSDRSAISASRDSHRRGAQRAKSLSIRAALAWCGAASGGRYSSNRRQAKSAPDWSPNSGHDQCWRPFIHITASRRFPCPRAGWVSISTVGTVLLLYAAQRLIPVCSTALCSYISGMRCAANDDHDSSLAAQNCSVTFFDDAGILSVGTHCAL